MAGEETNNNTPSKVLGKKPSHIKQNPMVSESNISNPINNKIFKKITKSSIRLVTITFIKKEERSSLSHHRLSGKHRGGHTCRNSACQK